MLCFKLRLTMKKQVSCVRIVLSSLLPILLCQKHDKILRNDFETPDAEGNYRWALQTEGGIYHEQRGTPVLTSTGPSSVVEGQYQYTAPDGQVINLLYTADEYGFHPQGDHLPTPPPIPAAIQRALDYIAKLNNNSL